MKRNTYSLICVSILMIVIAGCKKEKTGPVKNYIKIGETEYKIEKGSLEYNKDYPYHAEKIPDGYSQLHLVFDSDASQYLGLYAIVSVKAELDIGNYDGTYDPPSGSRKFTSRSFVHGEFFDLSTDPHTITGIQKGTMSVRKEDSVYEISIKGNDKNGKAITVYYKGKLSYSEISK